MLSCFVCDVEGRHVDRAQKEGGFPELAGFRMVDAVQALYAESQYCCSLYLYLLETTIFQGHYQALGQVLPRQAMLLNVHTHLHD